MRKAIAGWIRSHLQSKKKPVREEHNRSEADRIEPLVSLARAMKIAFYARLSGESFRREIETRKMNERNSIYLQNKSWQEIIRAHSGETRSLLQSAYSQWILVNNPPGKPQLSRQVTL